MAAAVKLHRHVGRRRAARFLAEGGCRIALVTMSEAPAFTARLAALSKQAELIEQVAGMNIGKVKKDSIGVYRLRAS